MSAKSRSAGCLSFSEAIDSFLLYLAVERRLSENYQLSNHRSLQELAAWCQPQGLIDPGSVKTEDLTAYLSHIKGRGLAPASMRLAIIAIRLFFGFLRSRHGLKRDPAELLRTPKLARRLPSVLNEQEAKRLVEVDLSQHLHLFMVGPYWHCAYTAPNGRYVKKSTRQKDRARAVQVALTYINEETAIHSSNLILEHFQDVDLSGRRYPLRDRAILETLYGCGLRSSELCNLQLANVNLEEEERFMRVVGKGNKTRMVPIGRKARAAILIYLKHERSRFTSATRDTGVAAKNWPQLFLSQKRGKLLTYQGVWQIVTKLAALTEFEKKIYPHLLRHTYATHLLEHGVDIRFIQELLGHASIETTQIYLHASPKHLQAVFKRCHPRSGAMKPHEGTIQPSAAA
jgi:integrase/recombinase XerD